MYVPDNLDAYNEYEKEIHRRKKYYDEEESEIHELEQQVVDELHE